MGVSRRGFLRAAGAVAGALALSGCGGSSNADERVYVGIVNGEPAESGYRKATDKSMHEALDQRDDVAPEYAYESKSKDQTTSARELVQKGVKYLLASPESNEGWEALLKDAYDAGTLTILFDRALDVDEELYAAAVVADAGAEARDAVDWLAGRGLERCDIVHIQGVMGSDAQIGRTEPLNEQVAAEPDTWHLVVQQAASWDEAEAKTITEAAINSGNPFNVIYAENDGMARGAVAALDEAGITHGVDGDVIIMGFDTNRYALRELQAGNWNYDGQCSPYQAQIISDMIQQLEAGEALNLESKKIITEERGFDAATITEEDIVNYGIGDDPGVIG